MGHFGPRVLFDEPMWRHTTFRIGGPADALVEVGTEGELKDLILWARDRGQPAMILGAGSNLLVRDGGVRGIMIKLAGVFEEINPLAGVNGTGEVVSAGAAVGISRLGKYALDRGLAGLNFTLGIPGTVGGAMKMNAGAWGACMADCTASIRVLDPRGDIASISRDRLRFSYRSLSLEENTVIMSGQVRLKYADGEALRKEASQMQRRRGITQPLSLPSAGSVFRNPTGRKTAGELIEQAGLKGLASGGAEVSTKHANFIVNTGQARASDVLELMRQVRETVAERFGVELEAEVIIIGQETPS